MFLSLDQILDSARRLADVHPFFGISFFAFKKSDLPVGFDKELNFTRAVDDILQKHYRASSSYDGFYSPFKTSNPEKHWRRPRYGSTSLQRITADTFSDALIHTKNTSAWGWQRDYLKRLSRHLRGHRLPSFDLAVWFFRGKNWGRDCSPEQVRDYLFREYSIGKDEIRHLFEERIPAVDESAWLQESAVSEHELLDALGWPPGVLPEVGLALHLLELEEIGPVKPRRCIRKWLGLTHQAA
jgi:hypothetical protein